MPGIKEALKQLKDEGYLLAVASSSPAYAIKDALKSLDMEKYFTVVMSGDYVEHPKPAPDTFRCNGRETGNGAGGLSGSRGFGLTVEERAESSRYEMYLVPQPGFRKAGYPGCGTGISGMDQRKCRKNAENIRKRGRVKMRIRTADLSDLKEIARVEAACFPAAEAATEEEFEKRLTFYKDHFWLMFDGDKLIAFVDGFVTDEENLTDEMYAKAQLHNESGAWQMIFGVNTIPAYRKHG